jgi:predicted PurR-regulated permease PerM
MIHFLSKSPFYFKAAIFLVGLYIFISILYIGQEILIPITFSVIVSILLSPVVNFLEKNKFGKVGAILVPLTITIVLITSLLALLLSEAGLFSKVLPVLESKIRLFIEDGIPWLSAHLNISENQVRVTINNTKTDILNSSGELISHMVSMLTNTFMLSILIPIYVFMILYYRLLILEFIRQFFDVKDHARVGEIIIETKSIIKNYLVGLLIETVIIALLYTLGLWVLAFKYAILLGVIGALINVIPYLGGLISIALYVLLAFLLKDSFSYPILVLVLYSIIQFIDKHYILPKLVASKVNVNALMAVIMILVGGALWGISGMFLSIPFTGIMKVIFDRVDIMKPWGVLLGDTIPDHVKFRLTPTIKKK